MQCPDKILCGDSARGRKRYQPGGVGKYNCRTPAKHLIGFQPRILGGARLELGVSAYMLRVALLDLAWYSDGARKVQQISK